MLFLSLSVIWGLPYFLIRVAVADLEPGFLVAVRMLIAAAILVPIALLGQGFGGLRGHWRWVVVLALVEMVIPFGMLSWAETRLSSSVAGLMIAAVPLVSAVIAARLGLADRLDGRRYLGLGIGLAGVLALVGLDLRIDDALAVAAMCLVVVGYAVGPILLATVLAPVPGPPVMAAASSIAALMYLPWFIVGRPTSPVPATAWWAVVGLGVVCSALAFLVFYALVDEVGPTRMTVITYLNPVVAVLLGVGILAEPLTTGILLGFPLIIVGSYLSTTRSRA
jgi:drug/metabolite transporter (DMT)-like permease